MTAKRGQVRTEEEVVAEVALLRAAGCRVVFTNGGFDGLHVGHVRMLQEAATLADVLVVAVNSDESVAAAKGPGRPVLPAAERAELVAAVAGVDLVFVFPDRTVDRQLRTLRPEIHAKGRDYAEATHPEGATNRELGVRMAFVGDEKGHSSTDLWVRATRTSFPADQPAEVDLPGVRGILLRPRRRFLEAHGLLDLGSLLALKDGVETNRHATRVVRRIERGGLALFVKTEWAATRRGKLASDGAIREARHHLALRAAGFLAPEPLLALEGRDATGERRAGALVTLEAKGTPLDRLLRERLPGASGRTTLAWARGVGLAIRALHTARFLHPDLHAYHLVVDGDPAAGPCSIAFLDLARLERAKGRVGPNDAAAGLAALAITLRGSAPRRFRLAILRAYLGGNFKEGRQWLRAIEKRIARVEGRGAFKRYPAGT